MKGNYVGFTTFNHLNYLSSSIQFVIEIESDSMIPLLGAFGFRKKQAQPTHTGRYLILEFNHSLRAKSGIIQSLHNRASTKYQDRQDRFKDTDNL
jgi:hypothetical protein